MKHAVTNNLIMIAELTIKPNKLEEFLEYTLPNLEVSRSYPGNIEFDILTDQTKKETVLFYEVWESAEAQQAYMAWRVEAGDLTTLLSFMAEPPKFSAFSRVDA